MGRVRGIRVRGRVQVLEVDEVPIGVRDGRVDVGSLKRSGHGPDQRK